jgi:hypothetical protein
LQILAASPVVNTVFIVRATSSPYLWLKTYWPEPREPINSIPIAAAGSVDRPNKPPLSWQAYPPEQTFSNTPGYADF